MKRTQRWLELQCLTSPIMKSRVLSGRRLTMSLAAPCPGRCRGGSRAAWSRPTPGGWGRSAGLSVAHSTRTLFWTRTASCRETEETVRQTRTWRTSLCGDLWTFCIAGRAWTVRLIRQCWRRPRIQRSSASQRRLCSSEEFEYEFCNPWDYQ